MRYFSTRNSKPDNLASKTFKQAVLAGYASDGGLYVPETLPKLSLEAVLKWKDLPYWRVAAEICHLFVGDELDISTISGICEKAVASFDRTSTIELSTLTDTTQILELYHGATGAFKDLAMSAFAGFVEHLIATTEPNDDKIQRHLVALVSTTGDTGPAALASFANFGSRMSIINMYARGWCTSVQDLQMVKSGASNAYVWQIEGTPDTMDRVIARVFNDDKFLAAHPNLLLLSVNSLNWFRIMYQIAHYFWTFLQLYKSQTVTTTTDNCALSVRCFVPTSTAAAGHVTSGVCAKLMGLPIQLIAVVNENDVMYRMLHGNESDTTASSPVTVPSHAKTTLATAMDGTFPYNFERLLYFVTKGDAAACRKVVHDAGKTGQVSISSDIRDAFAKVLRVERVSDEEIGRTMRFVHDKKDGKFICPHTACGVCIALREEERIGGGALTKHVCFATACAEKFSEAVERVGLTPDASFQQYKQKWETSPTRANIVEDKPVDQQSADSAQNAWFDQLETLIVNCLPK